MLFRRPSVRYGRTPEPETPYQKAAQAWDERIGAARVQARNWRLIAFGNLFLAAGLAGGLIWQAARGTITPWVVEVDKLGQAQAVSPAIADYRPRPLAVPAPCSDKDEARGNRLSRSKIIREVVENLCAVFRVDSHTIADHLLDGGVPTFAGQSGRCDDHAQVVTGLARAGHEVPIGPGR
jgi:hypothetical protein